MNSISSQYKYSKSYSGTRPELAVWTSQSTFRRTVRVSCDPNTSLFVSSSCVGHVAILVRGGEVTVSQSERDTHTERQKFLLYVRVEAPSTVVMLQFRDVLVWRTRHTLSFLRCVCPRDPATSDLLSTAGQSSGLLAS